MTDKINDILNKYKKCKKDSIGNNIFENLKYYLENYNEIAVDKTTYAELKESEIIMSECIASKSLKEINKIKKIIGE